MKRCELRFSSIFFTKFKEKKSFLPANHESSIRGVLDPPDESKSDSSDITDTMDEAMSSSDCFNLTCLEISPWQINFNKGLDKGKSTNRLSCKVLAKKTPKNQNNLDALAQISESCGKGAGKSPEGRTT